MATGKGLRRNLVRRSPRALKGLCLKWGKFGPNVIRALARFLRGLCQRQVIAPIWHGRNRPVEERCTVSLFSCLLLPQESRPRA